ncbi:hypothetical protein ACH5RR_009049 [Cinchona calisaya]|uniref:Uncharacterized protein n=1 Tax=Cinchona calisaya TaxID=153742 RepID=A0ABD3AGV3_9GENT
MDEDLITRLIEADMGSNLLMVKANEDSGKEKLGDNKTTNRKLIKGKQGRTIIKIMNKAEKKALTDITGISNSEIELGKRKLLLRDEEISDDTNLRHVERETKLIIVTR